MAPERDHYAFYFLDYLADALWTAYFDQQEITVWADQLILKCDAPRQWLINLSLSAGNDFPDNNAHPLHTGEIDHTRPGFPAWQLGYVRCYESFLWAKHAEGRLSEDALVLQYINVSGREDFDPAQLLRDMHQDTERVAGFAAFMRQGDLYECLPYLFDSTVPVP